MKRETRLLLILAGLAAIALVGTAVFLTLTSRSGVTDSASGGPSPLGGLFERASAVSALKEKMGDLRAFYPSLEAFAKAHQDELPKTINELHPFLPPKLAYLDDEHWELPSTGNFTLLVSRKDSPPLILLQEKNVPADKSRIVIFADGHIEYRK